MSLNRWIFKWHLKVRMLSHSQMSAGREFQADGAATEKARRASLVCMRGTTSSGTSEERREHRNSTEKNVLFLYLYHKHRHKASLISHGHVQDVLFIKMQRFIFNLLRSISSYVTTSADIEYQRTTAGCCVTVSPTHTHTDTCTDIEACTGLGLAGILQLRRDSRRFVFVQCGNSARLGLKSLESHRDGINACGSPVELTIDDMMLLQSDSHLIC